MEDPRDDRSSDRAALAEVIHLRAAARARTEPDAAAGATRAPSPAGDDGSAARDRELLKRRYGDRWVDVPAGMGRSVATLERLLATGPTAVDSATASASQVVVEAWLVVRAAVAHAVALEEEAEVLGEGLGMRLTDLPLRHLDQVVGAVLDLALVRSGDPSWADPAGAGAAHLVLDAHGPDVRDAARLHRDVYERFTEQVWEIPEARLRAGRRPWRLISRLRLRADLAAVSRSGKVPGSLAAVADLLLRASAARQRLADLAPLLERHLGRHDQGPLTEVDAVTASLDAVLRLQRLLGDRLDAERLHGLLLADAFTSAELTAPALNLRSALRAWQAEVARLCGGDPWSVPAGELAGWASRTGAALPGITAALSAMAELDQPPSTLRELVDDLLLREHADEVGRQVVDPPAVQVVDAPAVRVESGSAS